ncbi:MAG: hypothetical protein LBR08_01460 [Bacteroidales bacterium]|nr:hypothetical protein [Bacteroidales bacterium]
MKSLILTKQLRAGEYHDFDYDSQIIAHEKWDAKKTCKMNTGYFGGAATISKLKSISKNISWLQFRSHNFLRKKIIAL